MATAKVSRKWLEEAAEDTLTFIASLRSQDREKVVARLIKPKRLWTGNYRIMPLEAAKAQAQRDVPDFRYGLWERRVRALRHIARAAKGDVTISQSEAAELRK